MTYLSGEGELGALNVKGNFQGALTALVAPPRSGRGGSQVQIVPLRPAFLAAEAVTENDMGKDT